MMITLWNFLGCFVRPRGTNEVLFILHTDFLFCFAWSFSLSHLSWFIIRLAGLSMKAIFLSLFGLLNEQDFLWSVIFNNNEILETPLGVSVPFLPEFLLFSLPPLVSHQDCLWFPWSLIYGSKGSEEASSYLVNTQYWGIALECAQQAVHAINELMAQLNQRFWEGGKTGRHWTSFPEDGSFLWY